MGESIFNFVLSDVNGIPALPVFIGNYLLDLLSTFFPIFILLSSFVMVYVGFTRGSGDWKQTAQQIAPTAVSMAVIMGLLSMKAPYTDAEKQALTGKFWEDTNSYTVVEMMNTFLGFGNIFADALTHKIIYGSIDVTPGNITYEGYFPAVLQQLITNNDNNRLTKQLLENAGKDEILDTVLINNDKIAAITNNIIQDMHILGISRDFRTITKKDLENNQKKDYFRIKYYTNAVNEVRKEDVEFGYYRRPFGVNDKNLKREDVMSNKDNDKEVPINIKQIVGDEVVSIDINDLLEKGRTEGDNKNWNLDMALKKYYLEEQSNAKASKEGGMFQMVKEYTGWSASPKEASSGKTLAYLYKDNNTLYNNYRVGIELLLENYIAVCKAYDVKISKMKNIKSKTKSGKITLNNIINTHVRAQGKVLGQIEKVSALYKSYVILQSKITGKSDSTYRLSEKIDSVKGAGYFDSIPDNLGISVDSMEKIVDKNENLPSSSLSFFGLVGNSEEIERERTNKTKVINLLNDRANKKNFIALTLYKKYKTALEDDSLFQDTMGYNKEAPWNRLYLSPSQYKTLAFMNIKEKEIYEKYGHKPGSVAAQLKKDIEKQYTNSDLNKKVLIHWTDLGKHYALFKNLYSPLITNIYFMSEIKDAKISKTVTLAKFMEELQPGEKASRILSTAAVFAGANIVKGAGTAIMNKAGGKGLIDTIKSKNEDSGLGSLWDVIKIIGGVYFAILFINVILPAFVWFFVIVTYYVEMSLYVAVFPIGFMFMIFQSYRQSLHQYINMLLGFILMPIILVSMYFVILYIDMLLPMFFKQFMPFFGSYDELGNAFKAAFGGSEHPLATVTEYLFENGSKYVEGQSNIPNAVRDLSNDSNWLMSYIGNMIYTLLSMLMSVLLLMTFFRANEYMSKILNVSTVGMDSFQGRDTLNKFGSFDKTGLTAGVVGR